MRSMLLVGDNFEYYGNYTKMHYLLSLGSDE